MNESAAVTIINQRQGKIVLGPDPRLKKGEPGFGEHRHIPSGGSVDVTAAEAESLLRHHGIVDAAKLAPGLEEEKAKLRSRIAELEAENAKLKGDESADELGDGDAVVLPKDGGKGVIKSIKGKKAKVELESGEVVELKLADLKPAE